MDTLTLKVPREMTAILNAVAAKKRIPKSKYVRDLLSIALKKEESKLSLYDRMKDGVGCVSSGKGDLSTNPKHMKGFGKWRR
jgi:hypothetical protein